MQEKHSKFYNIGFSLSKTFKKYISWSEINGNALNNKSNNYKSICLIHVQLDFAQNAFS